MDCEFGDTNRERDMPSPDLYCNCGDINFFPFRGIGCGSSARTFDALFFDIFGCFQLQKFGECDPSFNGRKEKFVVTPAGMLTFGVCSVRAYHARGKCREASYIGTALSDIQYAH